MKKYSLNATKRSDLGRKVKKLRVSGQIPAVVYGKKVKSVSITVPADAFAKTYGAAGETGLIELSVDDSIRPVLVHHVQKDPVTWAILHIEFHQVDLKEKVHADVPLEITGDCPAVLEKRGVLLTILDEIEVEGLPTDLVEKIAVDVTGLSEVNQEVKIADLKIPAGLTVLSDKELTVVKVGSLITKEAEAEAASDAAKAAEAAATEAAAAEGIAPATEGEAATDKPKEETKAT